MTRPLISVVVPIYNQEPYLPHCLQSLFSQGTDRIEFILMDDGSTDRSAEICEEFMERYPCRAALIRQENHGLLKTRQIGLSKASGEYILCADSDDALLEGALETLTGILDKDPADIVLFNATNDPDTHKPLFSYPFRDGQVFSGQAKQKLYRLMAGTDKFNNIWAKCVKKKLFEDEEVYRDIEGISNGEDLYQSLVLFDRARRIRFCDQVLYYYRVNQGSMSRKYNPQYFSSEKKVCVRRLAYAKKWSTPTEDLVKGAEKRICRILRDVSRKVFVSDMTWPQIEKEMRYLRGDPFYRKYYLKTNCAPDKRDLVLKSPLPVLRVWKLLYGAVKR